MEARDALLVFGSAGRFPSVALEPPRAIVVLFSTGVAFPPPANVGSVPRLAVPPAGRFALTVVRWRSRSGRRHPPDYLTESALDWPRAARAALFASFAMACQGARRSPGHSAVLFSTFARDL